MQHQEVAQGERRAPARRRVVAYVEHPADREVAAGDFDDEASVFVRDPAPDAVQRDDVELGKIVAGCELGKGAVEDLEIGPRGGCQLAGVAGLTRVEVSAPELAAAG